MPAASEITPEIRLAAIGLFDGRYADIGQEFSPWFSEFGLIHARLTVETQYLKALSQIRVIRPLTDEERDILDGISGNFDLAAGLRIKEIERKTRHDVQAAVVYLKESLGQTSLSDLSEYVHFGLTSDDVNNLAWRLGLKEAKDEVILPTSALLIKHLAETAEEHKGLPMLARTHGQAAVPTTYGKELINFAARIKEQQERMRKIPLRGKLNGAVGNFNSLSLLYPKIDWIQFSQDFIASLGLEPEIFTTQVNPNDDIVEYLKCLASINVILHGLNRDMWRYISDDWVMQRSEGVGSSTMPQKVNPIDFEHSEGMIEIANGLIEVLARELPESRLQRDLSDTPLFRFLGEIHAATLDAWKKTTRGLKKTSPNQTKMQEELWADWTILAEPLQLLLRQSGVADAYDLVRQKTQGKHFSQKEWQEMVGQIVTELSLKGTELERLLVNLTPVTYLGEAVRLTEMGIEEVRQKQ